MKRIHFCMLVFLGLVGGVFGEMVEDFDGSSLVASWWGGDSTPPYVYTLGFANTQHVHSGSASLRVDFNKANDVNLYSFLSAGGYFNLRNYDYLSFWVYNTGTPLRIKVRLEQVGSPTNAWETDWAAIYPALTTTQADWENICVDLTRAFFGHSHGDIDMTRIGQIMLIVEPGDGAKSGTFWIDDVMVTRAPNGAPLDPFESDSYGWSAGGVFTNPALPVLTTEHFQNSGGPADLGQRSLKIVWTNKSAGYDNFIYTPCHDTNAPAGRIGTYTNFTLYSNTLISLWVKSTTDNHFPILLKLTGSKGTNDLNVYPQYYDGGGEWQQLMWWFGPYTNIAANLQTVWVFPYAGLADAGGAMYIDNLALVTGSTVVGYGPTLPLAPTNFTSDAGTPDEDGQFTVRWAPVSGATNYVFQQDTDINFTNPVQTSTTGTLVGVSLNPVTEEGTYYFRVRSMVGGSAGSFTAPLRVRVHQFPEAERKRDVICDFDSLGQVVAWWGSDAAAPWVYQQDFESTAHVHSGEHAMHVVFDKANGVEPSGETNAYTFFSAGGLYNFYNFDYLSFWVYNSGTPLRIKVRLEQYGSPTNAWETDWAAIYPELTTTQADWENITIDLTRAFYGHTHGDIDLTRIGQIIFMIEPNSTTAAGEFWMDDIAVHRAADSAPLDVFESDFYGWASGAPFAITNRTDDFFNDGGVHGLGQRSLIVSWGAKGKNFSNLTYDPGHDTNNAPVGRIGNHRNFAVDGHNTLEMRVKSDTDATIPFLLKFDGADVGYQTYTGSGAWQNVRWEFDTVPGKTDVGTLFVIPYPNLSDDGGVMYLDDLNLAGGTAPAIPYAPASLATTAESPDGDGKFDITWPAVTAATSYEIQEDTDPEFRSPVTRVTNTAFFSFAKDPMAERGMHFYRVRSGTAAGYGSFTAPISVQIVPPRAEQAEILSDFDSAGAINVWWGSDPSEPWVYQQDFQNDEHAHSGQFSMKVVYDKAQEVRTNEYGQLYTNAYSFMSASGLFNLYSFDYLSFWVYNTGTPLRIKVRLEQAGSYSNAWETDWASIYPQTVTTQADWENICIDLTRSFYGHSHGEIDMTRIGQIMFMIDPNDETAAGEFWMDDIVLRRAPNSAPLEPFESDFYGWASGAPFTITTTVESCHNDGTAAALGQGALKVTWPSKERNYSNITYDPAHDTNNAPLNRVGNIADFTLHGNTMCELWVRSPTETDMPILLKFDDADVGVAHYTGTGEWQQLVWDYSAVAGATQVTTVFVIPYPDEADDGGAFYLDDFNLFGGTAVPIPLAPHRFRTTAKNPDGDGFYHLRWDPVPGAEYELEEDDDPLFGSPGVLRTNVAQVAIVKDPVAEEGTYYYRVRSVIGTNYSSYAATIGVQVEYQPASRLEFENLETFDGVKQVAFWWANDPVAPYAYTLDFGSTQHVHSGVVALRVDYDKNHDANVYSFMSAGGLFNFRNHDYLSFWVYNDGSPLKFRIRLEDNAGGFFESNWAGIEPQTRTPAADWENLVFDLSRTYNADSIDMSAVAQILFMVAPEDPTNAGTFWMDDIQLQRAPNSAPIETFESDFYGWNGASHFVITNVPDSCHNEGSRTNIGQQSLRVAWTNKPKDYSSIQYDPGHDTNSAPLGRIGNYRDFTAGSNYLIEAWFMSATEFSLPILLKVGDADVGVQTYTGEGEWEKLTWDVSSVPGATNVELLFFLPYPGRADAEGVFYVDDINFAGGTPWRAPGIPAGVDATYPSQEGQYTVTWTAVSNITGYQVLEANNGNFSYPNVFYTTNLSMAFSHHPTNEGGTYYYRIRTYEVVNGVTNVGSYSMLASAYVPRLDGARGFAENMSYDTPCAEVDNINVPLWHTNTAAYRITVTHPKYYPVPINERGADFDDCNFTDRNIWRIGTNDGSSAEFRSSGYGDGDVYYALDSPSAGVDEAWSEFPAALDSSVMQTQIIAFSAEEISDVNLEPKIGSRLTVRMRQVTGTLEVRLVIGNGTTWSVVSNQVFDSAHPVRQWNTPDFFWSSQVDTNCLRLEVVTAAQGGQTTAGARGDYDVLELWKRDEAGETRPLVYENVPEYQPEPGYLVVYDDGNIIVHAIRMDFWWRAPEALKVITPQGTVYDAQYFRIVKRVPDTNEVGYSQVFVLYEDGNSRLLPHPPAGVDWTPFGASIIIGPTVESDRPFAGIKTVTIHPKDISMDVEYDDGGSCHVDLWVDREKNVVDISDIRYSTLSNSFARFRSMWVYDGKSDIDRAEYSGGVFPVTRHWDAMHGTWWKFFKEVPTYHNTYCPEFNIQVMDPIKAFLVRQAETLDAGSNYSFALRTAGRGGEAITMGVDGGEATYHVYLDRGRPNTQIVIRYADDDGGNNGDYPGNLVQVYVDGELKGQEHVMNSDGWNDFDMLPAIELGDMLPGWHTVRIVTGAGTFGLDLDEFQLISQPEALWTRESVLTRQGEDYTSASNTVDAERTGAVGGESIHMELSNSVAIYNINLASAITQAYMRVRYSDDVGPTMLRVFVDGQIKARFPTMDTGTWDDFGNSAELYMGDLTAGVHTVRFQCSEETWGLDVDEFEIYTTKIQNRAPQFALPAQFSVPVEASTNLEIRAFDGDGDDLTISAVSVPPHSGFNGRYLAVTTTVADIGTTNPASFTVSDGRGATNSTASGSTEIVVPADWDADELPDTWEWDSFKSLNPGATDDEDQDGSGNLHEYLAGTSPTNGESVFKLSNVDLKVEPGFSVEVRTQPGRRYEIWLSDGPLGTGTVWRTFGNSSNGVGTWVETNSVPSQFIFRDYCTEDTGGSITSNASRHYRVQSRSL